MGKEQKVQSEKTKRIKKKKHILHYLIVYLVCLLVAFATWLSVRYSMRVEEQQEHEENSLAVAPLNSEEWENTLYV